jgi:SAM-dependent methyltransferase
MALRNVVFITSVLIVGFCILLYFQTDDNLDTVNLEQYKNLSYNEERSHSLSELDKQISPYHIETVIQEIFEKNRLAGEKTRIMEIGIGNGRVLMELKKRFPDIEFYGINKEKTHTFYRRDSFILTALKFGIFNKEEIDQLELPYVVFQDLDFGGKIPYDDAKFDLIYSQNTIPHIKYKFELFNEILRVLKPEGLSLHTNLEGVNIYSKGLVLELRDALGELRKKGFDIKTLDNPTTIRFRKKDLRTEFPLGPHQPIPENTSNIPLELRRPEMGYNII